MITYFASHLDRNMANLSVPGTVRAQVQSNATRMAGLTPPAGVEPRVASEIGSSIAMSFLSGFRLIMWICAALTFVSSTIAWWTIPALSVSVGNNKKRATAKQEVEYGT